MLVSGCGGTTDASSSAARPANEIDALLGGAVDAGSADTIHEELGERRIDTDAGAPRQRRPATFLDWLLASDDVAGIAIAHAELGEDAEMYAAAAVEQGGQTTVCLVGPGGTSCVADAAALAAEPDARVVEVRG